MNAEELQTREIFIVWTNTDLTEGRGYLIPIAYCGIEATAKRLAKKKGVMGSDASVESYTSIKHAGSWVAPFYMETATAEDIKQQKKIEAYKLAIKRAQAAGLSDYDLAVLRGGGA